MRFEFYLFLVSAVAAAITNIQAIENSRTIRRQNDNLINWELVLWEDRFCSETLPFYAVFDGPGPTDCISVANLSLPYFVGIGYASNFLQLNLWAEDDCNSSSMPDSWIISGNFDLPLGPPGFDLLSCTDTSSLPSPLLSFSITAAYIWQVIFWEETECGGDELGFFSGLPEAQTINQCINLFGSPAASFQSFEFGAGVPPALGVGPTNFVLEMYFSDDCGPTPDISFLPEAVALSCFDMQSLPQPILSFQITTLD